MFESIRNYSKDNTVTSIFPAPPAEKSFSRKKLSRKNHKVACNFGLQWVYWILLADLDSAGNAASLQKIGPKTSQNMQNWDQKLPRKNENQHRCGLAKYQSLGLTQSSFARTKLTRRVLFSNNLFLDPERGASALKRIKTSLRSRLENPALEALIRITVEGPRCWKQKQHFSKRVRFCKVDDFSNIITRFRKSLGIRSKLAKPYYE